MLECEFSTEYFYLFDNPVLWMKTQQNEATYINLMGNINKPFAATGRFEVSFTPEPPRYHLELAIVGEWWQRARGSAGFTFVHSHRGATGIFLPICHVVYFRCGAKLTDPSSKIDVRRLNVGDLLIQICVHCLVFLVLGGRDQRPSSPATAASWEDTM